jgi:transposase-like protein
MRGRGPRPSTVTAQRRIQVADRYIRGETQSAIARDFGVSQKQISLDLAAIRKEWRSSSVRQFDVLIDEQLAKIDYLERESHAAWERSKQPREITVTEATEADKTIRKASVRKEGQVGDPRFLERIDKCIERRCLLLGLNAPEKHALTTPDGKEPYQPGLPVPDEAYFAKLAGIFQELGPLHNIHHDDSENTFPDALN